MLACEHMSVAYEVTHKTVLPFRWAVHTLRCTLCGVKAMVVNRTKVR